MSDDAPPSEHCYIHWKTYALEGGMCSRTTEPNTTDTFLFSSLTFLSPTIHPCGVVEVTSYENSYQDTLFSSLPFLSNPLQGGERMGHRKLTPFIFARINLVAPFVSACRLLFSLMSGSLANASATLSVLGCMLFFFFFFCFHDEIGEEAALH